MGRDHAALRASLSHRVEYCDMANELSELGAFANEPFLQERLRETFGSLQDGDIAVGVSMGGEQAFASTTSTQGKNSCEQRIHLGCLTKLFTVEMFECWIEVEKIDRDKSIGSQLGLPEEWAIVRHLTPRQLTDHTHGLDDGYTDIHLDGSSRIDTERLFDGFSKNAVSRPGELFSYSHAGAWIIAATLELAFQRTFGDLLREYSQNFDLLALPPPGVPKSRLNPATGSDLTISLRGLIRFLTHVVQRGALWPASVDTSVVTRFPGWSPFECGIFRGWKVIEDDWYGHSSQISGGDTAMVRINPRVGAAVVVISRNHNANVIGLRLLGNMFPGYASMGFPASVMPNATDRTLIGDAFRGIYRNGRTTIEIRSHECGGLSMSVAGNAVRLTIADRNILLAASNGAGIGFIQGVAPIDNRFRYVWDGRRVFLNTEDTSH